MTTTTDPRPPTEVLTRSTRYRRGLMWFRRDLRTFDNAALHRALRACDEVLCVFVFDTAILDSLPREDRRVEFIRESLLEVDANLQAMTAGKARLLVRHGDARSKITSLANTLNANAVFANADYEPQALERDDAVCRELAKRRCAFETFKDHVIFEREEVLTLARKPFSVFTPYKNAWLKRLTPYFLKAYPIAPHAGALAAPPAGFEPANGTESGPQLDACVGVPSLAALGFEPSNLKELPIPTGQSGGEQLLGAFLPRMSEYGETRNFPAVKGPSYLGVHLRFGTVSIRHLASLAHEATQQGSAGAAVWLSELIWRDFYVQILANFPHAASQSFKPSYEKITWETGPHADALFAAWCTGQTGYPLVDAAMAQINQTGYMHNRLRMVVASFLTKDLGLDWRWGERYFAQQLNDFDLSANNGGWQWASSSGCDAQPYFRIFNPTSQSEKFDPQGSFIRRYLPQLAQLSNASIHAPWLAKPMELLGAGVTLGGNYPRPVVMHDEARALTLERYAVVKVASS
jgi:deoxyribodipyrimidine photo-lyase